MQSLAVLLSCVGLIALVWGVIQWITSRRVVDAPLATTGDVANRGGEVAGPNGQISAQGAVSCREPLVAPFSGAPCLFYHLKATATWKERNGAGPARLPTAPPVSTKAYFVRPFDKFAQAEAFHVRSAVFHRRG